MLILVSVDTRLFLELFCELVLLAIASNTNSQNNSKNNLVSTETKINMKQGDIITLKKCYKINADKYAKQNFIGKFDEDRNEVHKYIINKKLNTVTRVWVLT